MAFIVHALAGLPKPAAIAAAAVAGAGVVAAEVAVENAFLANLGNLGGMGLLSAVLFYLHTTTLRAHREELAAERRAHREERDRAERRAEDAAAGAEWSHAKQEANSVMLRQICERLKLEAPPQTPPAPQLADRPSRRAPRLPPPEER